MPTARTLLTSLFLGLPFLVAPAILFAAPRPDVPAVADARPMGPAPTATLAASPSGALKIIPAHLTAPAASAVPCKAEGAVVKAHAGHGLPRQLIALN
ncbi:hypothetical protein [Nitrospirillum iridis]|uniref:Uncharacterized protein n=1 Tax=Nitrospirillum iridis TaxID=765888 RepID=A0A7X0B322_9PROT|nr:hypothetical protein [Nitrospirillum iridis]MBB6254825.1 hypothetical protein [Nitrospirillum iridis]